MNRTFSPKSADLTHEWYVVDAQGQTLGRLCTQIARVLSGKHKPIYAPHVDTGDFVIVINAEQTVLTGRKEEKKVYYRHSTYPGGLKSETAGELRNRRPTQIIRKGVRGMLPKNKLGRRQLRKLKIYAGNEHPHAAQKPQEFPLAG